MFNYIETFKFYFILLSLFSNLYALTPMEISQNKEIISLLEHSDVYFSKKDLSKEEIIENHYFKPYSKTIINNAQSQRTVWVHFKLENNSSKNIEKSLILTSPSLEFISLYEDKILTPKLNGIAYAKNHSTIDYSYIINIPAYTQKEYILKVASTHKSFFFKLLCQENQKFRRDDIFNQAPRLFMSGLLLGLIIYVFLLTFYSRDISYFFYATYLFFALWHQVTFLGLTQIYAPHWFVLFDMHLIIVKLGLALFFAVLFAISFLKIEKNTWLFKIYMFFLLISLTIIFLIKTLSIVLLVGVAFVFFNLFSSIYIYRTGQKQARLFIFGFGIVSIAYLIVISDSFGFTAILNSFPNILMYASTIEVLALTLAFADRYKILQKEKDKIIQERESIIKKEVIEKTAQLNQALEIKGMLLKEVHHRVKNNLQIILSILRLQNEKVDDIFIKENFINLENRINAIAKTYNMLIIEDNLEEVDMEEYVEALLLDIEKSMFQSNSNIELKTDIDVYLPLGKAVYIGIIINELITNSYKYAFKTQGGYISIDLYQENQMYILIISDNGQGFIYNKNQNSLGLKLIYALVQEQLKGTIEMQTKNSTKYIIKFKI